MPEIVLRKPTTVVPKKTTIAKKIPTSVLEEAIDVSELAASAADLVKICIYGVNRVGKTTLACLFPKPLLLIGCEPTPTGGAKSVTKMKGVKFLKLSSTEKMLRLADELRKNNPFKTVVIDSATSLQDVVLCEILQLSAVPTVMNWGMVDMEQYRQRSEKVREVLRPFLTELQCHTVVTAKERDHNPPKDGKPIIVRGSQQESFFSVDLGGQTAGWLQDCCDAVVQLFIGKEIIEERFGENNEEVRQIETGKTIRKLRLLYHPNYAAGLRSATPEKVPEFLEEPTYDKLRKIIDGV